MMVFDFIYFCIYNFVPNKAIFGKRDVTCTLFSSFTSMFLFGLLIICAKIFMFEINVALSGIILFGGLFVLTRVIYLKPVKFKNIHRKFRKISKWILNTIGIIYLLFCFFSFALTGFILIKLGYN